MSDPKPTVVLQGAAGEAVVMDDDEDEPVDGPEPEPLALPDALPIALVDESLPVSKSAGPSQLPLTSDSLSTVTAHSEQRIPAYSVIS